MGRLIGSKGVTYIAISCLLACVVISSYLFYEVCLLGAVCHVYLFEWLCIEFVHIHWGLVYDPLSVSMLLIINTVSMCAHVYSVEYMSADAHITRFISYLSLFTFFMLLLVLSDNVLQLFVG
jgi:NADH-quinone oxidoreductase subunit L